MVVMLSVHGVFIVQTLLEHDAGTWTCGAK